MTEPLYLNDKEISRKVLGENRITEWRGIVTVLERSGFPGVDTTFGGRYWKAVERWFDQRNGLVNTSGDAATVDGEERWSEWKPQLRRDSPGGHAKPDRSRTGSQPALPSKRDTDQVASD